jgi:hypothetical protein
MNEQGGSDEEVRTKGPYPSTGDTGPAVADAPPADIGQKVWTPKSSNQQCGSDRRLTVRGCAVICM